MSTIRIAISGGPGSGKTSLARQLTTKLYNEKGINTKHIEEYARLYIDECNFHGQFSPELSDQQLIFAKQVEREMAVPENVRFSISDSPLFLPLIFTFNLITPTLYQDRTVYLHLYNEFLAKYTSHYNYIFFVSREKPYLKDGTRKQSEEEAKNVDSQIVSFLELHKMHYHRISGTDEERVAKVLSII